jgi:endonuclease/exonuclease/phosphatase (EEP) superfamily protein YafD
MSKPRFTDVLLVSLSLSLTAQLAAQSTTNDVRIRIAAANLTSSPDQSYSPDNGNHSNPEGAGARILKGLQPDVVLIQEFNCTIQLSQWVNQTFGPGYSFHREDGPGIPNGIISRHPIVESGEWDDDTQRNRDFAWARIRLPNGRDLWAISVHLKAGNSESIRRSEAVALVRFIRDRIPANDCVVLGGDFNTSSREEPCIQILSQVFQTAGNPPIDQRGQDGTNASRRKPYDWVLADADLHPLMVPVTLGGDRFDTGLVLDTRVFRPNAAIAPAKGADSGVPNMQHMAVVKDFIIPATPRKTR